ncbi:MAG: EamA family transporter [Flavobacteriales bacterium]|nr:EamA family transporter [Flavobacteriales bacterium]
MRYFYKKIFVFHKNYFAHFCLFIANLIYALNYTFAKDVMPDYIGPSGFILLRVLGASIIFLLIYAFFIKEKVAIKDLLKIAVCSMFGVAINQLFFFHGLNLSTPINAAIIMTVNPIIVVVLSYFILSEIITIKKIIGILLAMIGALILILQTGDMSINVGTRFGNLLVLINASSYALYLVLVRPLMKKYHPITIMFFVFMFGLVFVTPFGYYELSNVIWKKIPSFILFEIVFVVFCTTVLAYLCNTTALKYLSASTVSTYIYLQPILATIFAVLMKSDVLSYEKFFSAILIFIGVYLVSISPLQKR